ncbi:hypothetical protein Tco_1003740 [Tanacetum coccineum]|uniref:Uncharacterized protein n=1 Tax=Tanacetum coccineum TaxID=301880 RepID=A0ABQ5FBT2_9ASTR
MSHVRPMIPNLDGVENINGTVKQILEPFYACSDSLLLTPLCCDEIHDVTPRVSTLAGCDKNHDPLALISHSNASSSHLHANSSYSPQSYYVTHPPSVVDYDDEYQRELQGDSQEDKLTTVMILLARAISQKFSSPTNNHLRVSSNIKSQVVVQDGRVDIQTKNTGNASDERKKPFIANTIIEDRDAFRSEVHAFVSQEFNAHAPVIIKELFKNYVHSNVVHVHPITTTSTETQSSATLQYRLYLKMNRSLQDRADDIALWEALRRKFEKSSPSNTSCREDDFHSQHDEHQDDDAPSEGEKRVIRSKGSKRSKSTRGSLSKHSNKDSTKYVSKQQSQQQKWDAWEEENVIDEDEVIPEYETPELISRNAEEYAYHLEQSTNFMENQIVWESSQQDIPRTIPKTLIFYGPQRNLNEPPRYLYNKDLFFLKYGNTEEMKYILSPLQDSPEHFLKHALREKLDQWVRKVFKIFNEDARITEVVRIVTYQPHGLDFMEQILVMRANDKPNSFSEADFKYLNKNDIEDLYYLCQSKEIDNQKIKLMNSLITFIRSYVIWERVYDFHLGIESYQMKVNLTSPILTLPGIKEHAPYSIVKEPQTCLIYLNGQDEKRVMYLVEIVKFCDATLEKVLNEVKLRMFESRMLKKPPLLSNLDQDIMKAYEREISKHLSYRQQMRRWESIVNGRPIQPTMKHL